MTVQHVAAMDVFVDGYTCRNAISIDFYDFLLLSMLAHFAPDYSFESKALWRLYRGGFLQKAGLAQGLAGVSFLQSLVFPSVFFHCFQFPIWDGHGRCS